MILKAGAQVKNIPLIDSGDVEGIAVESFSSVKEDYMLTIYFKKDSWDRIYDVTRTIRSKKLAVIRNRKLFTVPLVRDAIDASTSISGSIDAAKVKFFIDGLTPAELPDKSTRGKEYLSWLERRHADNNNDLTLASKLANKYMTGGTKDYAKAAQLFEMIIIQKDPLQTDPSQPNSYLNLGSCYARLGRTEEGINMYTKAISVQPKDEWVIRKQIAELYFSKGDKPKAISELSISISQLKKLSMPGGEGAVKSLELRLNEMKQ